MTPITPRGFPSTRHTSSCHYFLWPTDTWLGMNSVFVFLSSLPNCKQARDQGYSPQSGLEHLRRIRRLFLVTVIVANGSRELESSEENVSPTPLPKDSYLGFPPHQLSARGCSLEAEDLERKSRSAASRQPPLLAMTSRLAPSLLNP